MIGGTAAAMALLGGATVAGADDCGGCGSPPPPPPCHSCGPQGPSITNNIVNRVHVGDQNINIQGPKVNVTGPRITNNYNFGGNDCCGHGGNGGNQNQEQGQGQEQNQNQSQNQSQSNHNENNNNFNPTNNNTFNPTVNVEVINQNSNQNTNTANSYATATANGATAAGGAANAFASSLSNGSGFAVGGGGSFYAPSGVQPQGAINMCVDREQLVTKTRLIEAMRMIQAVCIDDRGAPHPASRLNDEEHVAATFSGELFRCVAGSYMQVTFGSESGSFDGGETMACQKGEALWHEASTGALSCRPQTPERDCFERSLLRKYGPGAKVLMTRREETYQEVEIMQCVSTAGLYLSGGVGGY
jgi:hypothetical protein